MPLIVSSSSAGSLIYALYFEIHFLIDDELSILWQIGGLHIILANPDTCQQNIVSRSPEVKNPGTLDDSFLRKLVSRSPEVT